jgi:hypothetical protein
MNSPQANLTDKTAGLTSLLTLGKYFGKSLPLGVGTLFSLASAGGRVAKNDYLGAGLDLTSAALSPWGVTTPLAWGIDAYNLGRDFLGPKEEPKHPFMNDTEETQEKAASSQFSRDITDSSAGTNSDLYGAVSPLISSEHDNTLTGADVARTKALKDQVRKGLVGLEYLTGMKKNKEESFYDAHPVEAVTTDVLSRSIPIGAGIAAGGVLENLRRQKKNMDKTEMAQMARSGNPLDTTNPTNLLDPSKESVRSDVSRIFGDFESNPEHRLKLLDSLAGSSNSANSFASKHKLLEEARTNATDQHNAKLLQLQNSLSSATNPKDASMIEAALRTHEAAHKQELAKLDKLKHQLFTEAKQSPHYGALNKYVNLHESLRRAREKGGLQGYIGENAGALSGVQDLLEKYNITGAHPNYNQELIRDIMKEYGGAHMSDSEWRTVADKILHNTGNPRHQASGLRKALSRAKGPLMYGTGAALAGTGVYQLLKMVQEQSHSKEKMDEWKKTILKSRGDFEGADEIQ